MRNRISRHFQNAPLSNFVASKLCRFETASLPKCVFQITPLQKITRKLTLIIICENARITVIVAGSGDMLAPEDGCNNYSGLRGGPRLATSPKGIALVATHRLEGVANARAYPKVQKSKSFIYLAPNIGDIQINTKMILLS